MSRPLYYVRTATGVYEYVGAKRKSGSKSRKDEDDMAIVSDGCGEFCVYRTEIICRNESLERIVDCFVEKNGRNPPTVISRDDMRYMRSHGHTDCADFFYGAIWTEGPRGTPVLKGVARYDHSWKLALIAPVERKGKRK